MVSRIDVAFGMRHQSKNPPRLITDSSYMGSRAVGVVWIGNRSVQSTRTAIFQRKLIVGRDNASMIASLRGTNFPSA